MEYIIAILVGYGFGCINPAYFFAKAKGFDIRTRGTGNCGASNAKVTMGWKYGVICAIYDALKAGIAITMMRYVFHSDEVVSSLAGVMAVVGHCFPFYIEFKGGKGFASFMGMALFLDWRYFIGMVVVGVIFTLISNWIVSATFTAIFSFPIYTYIMHQPIEMTLIIALCSLMIFLKHLPNIRKFIRKREIGLNGKAVGIALIHDDLYIVEELKKD